MEFGIAVFGAFDINSLGDMLFPKALEVELGKRIPVRRMVFFSPSDARSEYGRGYEVYPYEEFEKIHAEVRFDAIVIGGGELLHNSEIKFTNIQGETISCRNGRIWKYPVEMGKKHRIKVLVNSVGMPCGISRDDREVLAGLDYVSFRDRYSFYRFCGARRIPAGHVVPDSLWNLDDYFPVITDGTALRAARRIIPLEEGEEYAVLQMGTLDNWPAVYECTSGYCKKARLKLVVMAVNWCHDDRIVVREAANLENDGCIVLDRLLSMEEIITVIAGASVFVGTSLHGTLTACLGGTRTAVYNMYSHFASKMDGLADWLGVRDLLADTPEQLAEALEKPSPVPPVFPIQEIKATLCGHFDLMASIISGSSMEQENKLPPTVDHQFNLDRSFLEWKDRDGRLAWRTVIAGSTDDTYKVEEHVEAGTDIRWLFRTLDYHVVKTDPAVLVSVNADGDGRCYDRTMQFRVKDTAGQISFQYSKTLQETTEDFRGLLQRYWNRTAHVELLEKSERKYIAEINGKNALIEANSDFEKRLLSTERAMSNIVQAYNREAERTIASLYSEKESLQKENNALKQVNAIELETNTRITQELESLEEELVQLKDREKLHQGIVEGMQRDAENLRQAAAGREQEIEHLQQTAADMQQTIRNKEGHIELLLEVEREYEREKKSRTYRTALAFRKISIFFLPAGSRRRFFCRLLAKSVRHPVRMVRMINPRRVRNCFTILRTEGTESASRHLKLVEEFERSGSVDAAMEKLDITQTAENWKQALTLADYAPLLFHLPSEPLVSIVIPIYNQFDYTYHCLESILRHSGNISYEILLADDCSTDLTGEIEKVVTGIRVIRNRTNLRFLLNCNNAAAQAKGKYILFLNNDTQVQADWLRPLAELMEADPSIGLTGSKLVYSDGHLQEAGGIFWNDASAWNYGHMQNPEDPEYNYVKEADYISGASIMVRRSLWEEIGGFDERFAPAYYEDSDLAFEVRKRGYRVVYQPLSVVVHFEGVSNGTDLTSGQKAYQAVNQQKFYEKWKNVLERDHFPNGENVFLAKDRSRGRKQILVVDHYVPHYDRDAGGKCTYMYLLLFVRMGFKVTFIGDNFYKHEPYTTDLNQHGIEVLYGNYYFNNWKQWLQDNLHYFDYVYLQRPHISIKYIDLVRKYGRAKVFYFAHDLHHIREYREYQLTHDEEKLKSSEHWKKIEYELFEKADVGHVVGSYEQEIMQKAFPDKPIRNIPLYIYEDIPADISKNFRERHDLLYVGGFGHPPNIDAVLWFGREVFPRILEKYPDIKWHVVGGKVPAEIQAMAGDNVIIEGFLSDEKLHGLYRECRLAVVPLRVGAGVKGKVVEAAYFQIPLVTTTIGAEGLDAGMGNMAVGDDAAGMAELVCSLYGDCERLGKMSDAGSRFISKYFTMDQAKKVLELDIVK